MGVILAAKGSARRAFGIHGLTAVLMILAGVILTTGSGSAFCRLGACPIGGG